MRGIEQRSCHARVFGLRARAVSRPTPSRPGVDVCAPGSGRALAGARGNAVRSLPMATKEELYDRAIDFFADGELDKAIETYRAAIALDESYVDAWHGLAMAYNDAQRYDEAIEAGKRLCELTPDDVLAHTSLSRFYQAAGRVPEAEAEGAKARMLDWKRQLKESKPE
jgi:tetratricopeptide (TPR) repeat protein